MLLYDKCHWPKLKQRGFHRWKCLSLRNFCLSAHEMSPPHKSLPLKASQSTWCENLLRSLLGSNMVVWLCFFLCGRFIFFQRGCQCFSITSNPQMWNKVDTLFFWIKTCPSQKYNAFLRQRVGWHRSFSWTAVPRLVRKVHHHSQKRKRTHQGGGKNKLTD